MVKKETENTQKGLWYIGTILKTVKIFSEYKKRSTKTSEDIDEKRRV